MRDLLYQIRKCGAHVLLVAFLVVQVAWGAESQKSIAVVYPDASPSSKAIYDDIRSSVVRRVKQRGYRTVELVASRPPLPSDTVLEWARTNNVIAAVTLGRLAHDQVQTLRPQIPIVAGAVTLDLSPTVAGVDLTPNPRLILGRLRELAPEISRVLIVINPEHDERLVRSALSAARSMQLDIATYPARDIREASQHWWNALQYGNPRSDAIWILDDSVVDAENTLPKILETAWSRNFVVISNVVEHVRRGALLATFVDPTALGDRLANLATDAANGKDVGQSLGEDVKFAVNARAALHLGLQLNERTKSRYGLVLGER